MRTRADVEDVWELMVGQEAFCITSDVAGVLKGHAWVAVDYTPGAREILRIADADGRPLFQPYRYTADL